MAVRGLLENIRKWVDGEEDLGEAGEERPRSKWDDFLVAIAREIEASMQREMFTPPGGPTYVPREYLVFLNPEDDAEWQGEKREGLSRGLHYVLSERAKELAGANEFQTNRLTIELRVDPSLEKGKFRVQHVWDTEAQKTMVRPRKRSPDQAKERSTAEFGATPATQDDEATVVRPRKPSTPVFSISLKRTGNEGGDLTPEIRPFFKDEISIGRGSRQLDVDLRLEGDLEVSRQHATLARGSDGSFLLTCKGANSIVLDDKREIASGDTATIRPGEKISICSYELMVTPEG